MHTGSISSPSMANHSRSGMNRERYPSAEENQSVNVLKHNLSLLVNIFISIYNKKKLNSIFFFTND